MMKRITNLKKVAVPANPTEVFALLAVIGGLCIAIFLPELPIRLIGACISALGAVGHFMLISQRLAEAVNFRQTEVSQPTTFRTTVKKDNETTRVVFDDYASSFGCDDLPSQHDEIPDSHDREISSDSKQENVNTDAASSITSDEVNKKLSRRFADDQPVSPASKQVRKRFADPDPDLESMRANIYDDIDDVSAVRIVGPKAGSPSTETSVKPMQKTGNATVKNMSQPSSLLAQRPSQRPAPAPASTPVYETVQTVAKSEEETVESPNILESNENNALAQADNASAQFASMAAVQLQTSDNDAEVAIAEPEEWPLEQESKPEISTPGHKRTFLDVPKIDFFEETSLLMQNEPRKELDYLLARVLMVIRSVTSARTAVFLWVDNDKQKLVVESFISDASEHFTQQKKLPFGTDVVCQIARSGRPEILTEIKPAAELDLIPYYTRPADTLSFIGVPVFYNNSVVGVLCADTTQPDAYDAITVGFFGHFTKLISGLVHSYTDKYDLMQATRALEAITQFRALVSASQSGVEDVCTALLEAASKTVDYTTLGVIVFDERMNEWKVSQTMGRSDITPGSLGGVVNLHKSLAGHTIQYSKSNLVSPVYPGYLRCTETEDNFESGFFASVPLKSFSSNYGALFVEGTNPSINSQDMAILEVLGEQTGLIIEQIRFNDMLSSMSLVNETRGTLNPAAFRQRVNEELQRATDFNATITLCLVQLDKYASIDPNGETGEIILHSIIELIRKQVKPYDIVGELDSSTIALALVGQTRQKAQFWGERLRKEIASTVVQLENRRFTVTVSLGIAEGTTKDSPETLMNNAKKALQISLGRANAVTVYG